MKQLGRGNGELIRFDRVRRVRGLPIAILIIVLTAVFTVIYVSGRGDGSGNESETSFYETPTETEGTDEGFTLCETSTDSENTEAVAAEEPTTDFETLTTSESVTTDSLYDSLYEMKDLHGEGIVNAIGLEKNGYTQDYDFRADKSAIERCLPTVLIIHTHTSEAYSEAGGRSEDNGLNVTSVGKAFAERLSLNGICAIHCTVPFDGQTTMGAYSRAAEVIENYLRTYPEITYIVDIHRMSDTANGKPVKTLTDSDGAAQVRFTVSNSSCVIGEERNLAAALAICETINRTSEICTPIFEGEGGYNHGLAVDYGKYMLTVEIGAVGNTLEEAKRASFCIADALSKMIFGFG